MKRGENAVLNQFKLYLEQLVDDSEIISKYDSTTPLVHIAEQKRSTEGCLKLKKSGNKTNLGEIDLDIRTHASPKVGQDLVSGGVSVLC